MAVLLKELVPSILGTRVDWRTSLLSQWDSLVGSLKTRVRLEKIQEDTLIIGVYESHWMQELYLLSDVLIDSINQFLGEPRIKQLRFKLVEERKFTSRKLTVRKRANFIIRSTSVELTHEQSRALTQIPDGQLKDALIQFWARCLEK